MTHSQDEFDTDGNGLRNAPLRRRPLDRPERIRREVTRLFWRWHDGDLDAESASKMGNLLRILHTMIEGTETARRIAALEAKVQELSAP